jgi:hypothetical protein
LGRSGWRKAGKLLKMRAGNIFEVAVTGFERACLCGCD